MSIESKFVTWEGSEYRIDFESDGFPSKAFDVASGEAVSGKLISTLLFEGQPSSAPISS